MTLSWVRNVFINGDYSSGQFLLGRLSNGQTYVRTHFQWGIYGDTADTVDLQSIAGNLIIMGIVTVFGDGTETAPNPASAPDDADPPTQRWLWWETRAPVPRTMDHAAGVVTWTDSPPPRETDIKAQVLATGVPGGDQLDLWASWASHNAWDSSGSANVWLGASVLYKH